MDCVPGVLLIYRVKHCPEMEKEIVYQWFRDILVQMEQYRKCHNDQSYRYINPYSLLVTKENHILLLDLDAESNAFVLKNMQTRAMRNHFVKPIVHIKENSSLSLDLYGYAQTVQFILAGTQIVPSLNRWEELRLSNLIEKCLSEDQKKQFETIQQVIKKLPSVKNQTKEKKKGKKETHSKKRLLIGLGVFLLALFCGAFAFRETEQKKQAESYSEKKEIVQEKPKGKEKAEKKEGEEWSEGEKRTQKTETMEQLKEDSKPVDGLEQLEEEMTEMEQFLLQNTRKENQQVIEQGELMQRELFRYLAAAYDREEEKEKALRTYEILCELEEQPDFLENAYVRRISLEMELDAYGRKAIETGKEAREKFPDSESVGREYVKVLCQCKEIEETERVAEIQSVVEQFSALKELECYQNWKGVTADE